MGMLVVVVGMLLEVPATHIEVLGFKSHLHSQLKRHANVHPKKHRWWFEMALRVLSTVLTKYVRRLEMCEKRKH